MSRAEGHAERVEPGWRELALVSLEQFLAGHDGSFLTEQFIEWSRKNGVEQPPDDRAWGPVITRAFRRRIIERVGFALARTSNLGPKSVWRRVS